MSTARNASANWWTGVSSHFGRLTPIGLYVPQCTGITTWARNSVAAVGCTLWVEAPLAEGRAPAPDRKERHIDRSQVGHRVEQVGVSGEVHRGVGAAQHVADGLGDDTAVRAAAWRVDGTHGLDREAAGGERVTGLGLVDVLEALAPQPARHPPAP